MIPLTAFWCLSEAALKATSSIVTSLRVLSDGLAFLVKIVAGVGLNVSSFPPVGKSSVGNLFSGKSVGGLVVKDSTDE